jgi:hypothetical protein
LDSPVVAVEEADLPRSDDNWEVNLWNVKAIHQLFGNFNGERVAIALLDCAELDKDAGYEPKADKLRIFFPVNLSAGHSSYRSFVSGKDKVDIARALGVKV